MKCIIFQGYIPSRKFHFSDTYKVESDICIDDFLTNKREKLNKDDSLISNVLSQSKHVKITDNSDVKRSLDNYKDVNFRNTGLRSSNQIFLQLQSYIHTHKNMGLPIRPN